MRTPLLSPRSTRGPLMWYRVRPLASIDLLKERERPAPDLWCSRFLVPCSPPSLDTSFCASAPARQSRCPPGSPSDRLSAHDRLTEPRYVASSVPHMRVTVHYSDVWRRKLALPSQLSILLVMSKPCLRPSIQYPHPKVLRPPTYLRVLGSEALSGPPLGSRL